MKASSYPCSICGKKRHRFVFIKPPLAKFAVKDRETGKLRYFMCEKCWLPRMLRYYAEEAA